MTVVAQKTTKPIRGAFVFMLIEKRFAKRKVLCQPAHLWRAAFLRIALLQADDAVQDLNTIGLVTCAADARTAGQRKAVLHAVPHEQSSCLGR
jgi:hypothetical protein